MDFLNGGPQARYCVTEEEWYDDLVADPDAYGYTPERAWAERLAYNERQGKHVTDEELRAHDKKLQEWKDNRFSKLPMLSSLI